MVKGTFQILVKNCRFIIIAIKIIFLYKYFTNSKIFDYMSILGPSGNKLFLFVFIIGC